MKQFINFTIFVKVMIRKDLWTCSNGYYVQLILSLSKSNTINNFLSIIAILSFAIATCSTTLLIYFMPRRYYIATTWIFHRKLTFTLCNLSNAPVLLIGCILEPSRFQPHCNISCIIEEARFTIDGKSTSALEYPSQEKTCGINLNLGVSIIQHDYNEI